MSIMKILKRFSVRLSLCLKRFRLSIQTNFDLFEACIIQVEYTSPLDSTLFLLLKSDVLSKRIMMTWQLFLILSLRLLLKPMESIILLN